MVLRTIRIIKMDIDINRILKEFKRKLNYIINIFLYKLWKSSNIIFDFKNFKLNYLASH